MPGAPPTATLLINLAGCAALGLLVGLGGPQLRPGLRLPLAVGFLGSFTTFSTFSLEAAQLWQAGRGLHAVAYVLISVLGGIVAAAGGLGLGGLLRGAA